MINSIFRLLFLFLPALSWGQQATSNPYSYYGLGEMAKTGGPILGALGNASVAYADSTFVNHKDPSSYSRLAQGYPLFSIGFNDDYSIYNQNNLEYRANNAAIDHFILAIPFAKRYGLAFGLTPYSGRGYDFSDGERVGTDSLIHEYSGAGNISRVFVGFSSFIVNKENLKWSVGANGGYLFGSVMNQRISGIGDSTISEGGIGIYSERLKSFNFDVSTSIDYSLNENHSFHLAGAYEPSMNWKATFTDELYYAFDVEDPSGFQPKIFNAYDGAVVSPSSMSAGITYRLAFDRITKKNREYRSRLDFVLDYQSIAYSEMRSQYTNEGGQQINDAMFFSDYQHSSFGIQYRPNTKYYSNAGKTPFFSILTYRLGSYYDILPQTLDGNEYSQFGTTFGFGIPLVANRSNSSINFGFNYGVRSGTSTLKQTIYGFNLGIILSPSNADKWFRKIKLD